MAMREVIVPISKGMSMDLQCGKEVQFKIDNITVKMQPDFLPEETQPQRTVRKLMEEKD